MDVLEKYLPIGSVVMLKGGTKRVMIIGLCAVTEADKNKVWDYSGCLYPEGVLSSNQSCLFNHEQIEKIYHLGLIDEDEIAFKNQLKGILDKVNEIGENKEEVQEMENVEKQEETVITKEDNI